MNVLFRGVMDKVILTQEGYEKLKKELSDLIDVKRVEIANRLRDAIESGDNDLLENAEFEAIKNEQSFIEGRINEIERMLAVSRIADDSPHSGEIAIGSTITVQEDGEEEESYVIVGAAEANLESGKISYESPIGRAVMGHQNGDVVEVTAPAGAFRLKIVDVK